MKNKFMYLMRNLGLLLISNFSSKILSFLLVPLYTSILTTEEYGYYDVVQTTVQLLIPLMTIGVADAILRFSMDQSCDLTLITRIGIKRIIYATIIFIALSWGMGYVPGLKYFNEYYGYIILFFIVTMVNQIVSQLAKGLEEVSTIAVSGVLGTALTLICNIVFLIFLHLGIQGYFLAYILSQAIQALYIFIKIKVWRFYKKKIDMVKYKQLDKEMANYGFPMVFTQLSWWVNNLSDRYVIAYLCSIAENGIYSVAYKIPSIVNVVHSIFISAWQISAIKENESSDVEKFYKKVYILLNVLMCIVGGLIIIISKKIAYFLYAKDFFSAWQYVPFLIVSCIINAASGYIGAILIAEKKTKEMARSTTVGAIVNIFLNIILVLFFKTQGAAIATAISSLVIFELRFFYFSMRKEFQKIKKNSEILWGLVSVESIICIYDNSATSLIIFLYVGIIVFGVSCVKGYIKDFHIENLLKK